MDCVKPDHVLVIQSQIATDFRPWDAPEEIEQLVDDEIVVAGEE
jgi:hypothetical protein